MGQKPLKCVSLQYESKPPQKCKPVYGSNAPQACKPSVQSKAPKRVKPQYGLNTSPASYALVKGPSSVLE